MFDVKALVGSTAAEARPYQERIVSKVVASYTEKGTRSVLIESPTGSGKTVMALLIAKAMHEFMGARIGWVAMRRNLLTQAQAENEAKKMGTPITFISMFDQNPPTDLDMLIVDEAQHDVTSSMGHIHAVVKPTYILGMTATPFRADSVKLCFDTVIKDAGIATLIKEGYLAKYHHYTIPKWGVHEVVDLFAADRKRWGKSIMYFHRLAQCEEAAYMLREKGVTVEVITGSSDTEAQIERFKEGTVDVIVNCMKLTEGFDCPDLKTVFCRPSCKSVTVQMGGRVLRRHPDHPYKQIVQCEKTPHPFPRTALAEYQHLLVDGEWRTLEVNKNIDAINMRTIKALSKIEVDLPNFIKKGMTGTRRLGLRALRGAGTNAMVSGNGEAVAQSTEPTYDIDLTTPTSRRTR